MSHQTRSQIQLYCWTNVQIFRDILLQFLKRCQRPKNNKTGLSFNSHGNVPIFWDGHQKVSTSPKLVEHPNVYTKRSERPKKSDQLPQNILGTRIKASQKRPKNLTNVPKNFLDTSQSFSKTSQKSDQRPKNFLGHVPKLLENVPQCPKISQKRPKKLPNVPNFLENVPKSRKTSQNPNKTSRFGT